MDAGLAFAGPETVSAHPDPLPGGEGALLYPLIRSSIHIQKLRGIQNRVAECRQGFVRGGGAVGFSAVSGRCRPALGEAREGGDSERLFVGIRSPRQGDEINSVNL